MSIELSKEYKALPKTLKVLVKRVEKLEACLAGIKTKLSIKREKKAPAKVEKSPLKLLMIEKAIEAPVKAPKKAKKV